LSLIGLVADRRCVGRDRCDYGHTRSGTRTGMPDRTRPTGSSQAFGTAVALSMQSWRSPISPWPTPEAMNAPEARNVGVAASVTGRVLPARSRQAASSACRRDAQGTAS
jgi:hypothetical protein